MNLCRGFKIRAIAQNLKFLLTYLLSIKEYFEFSLLIAPGADGGILVKLGFSRRE